MRSPVVRDPVPHGTELLERAGDLDLIHAAVEAALAGEGSLLVLDGPPGIGKTRLLDAARRRSGERDLRVLVARGGRLERNFSYGVVRQLLERAVVGSDAPASVLLTGPAVHAGRALGLEAAPEQRATEDQAFAVRHGLYWLAANLAAAGPLLIVVDDVQWCDGPSLRFLAYLARRLEGLPVLVAVTARTGDPETDEQLLAELVDDPAARRISPPPLSVAATTHLLALAFEDPVEHAFATACQTATGGNPFLVHELRAALQADDVRPVAANAGRVAEHRRALADPAPRADLRCRGRCRAGRRGPWSGDRGRARRRTGRARGAGRRSRRRRPRPRRRPGPRAPGPLHPPDPA